jgi:hypothetical protein
MSMDLEIPKVLEFMQRKTLSKGRVETTLIMFLLDVDMFNEIATRYVRGEVSMLEARIGTTIKHPQDKFDKKVAKAEAAKKLRKIKFKIEDLKVVGNKAELSVFLEDGSLDLSIVRDDKGIRIYVV